MWPTCETGARDPRLDRQSRHDRSAARFCSGDAGDLDLKFGGDGRVITNVTSGYDGANDVAIQTNGKIVAVGSTYYWRTGTRLAMVRYRPNGTLDPTFSGNGEVIAGFMIDASDVAIQTDGKIVVVRADGTSFVVARYRRDGSLDPTFGTGGKVMTSVSDSAASNAAVALQADWATPVDRCVRLRPDQRWVRVPPWTTRTRASFPARSRSGEAG